LGLAGLPGDFLENRLEHDPGFRSLQLDDRRLAQELVFGVTRWRAALDWLIARKTNGRSQDPAVQTLLRLGLYQLFWLDRIPEFAAVNETVQLARDSGLGNQSGFINAVLRSSLRDGPELGRALDQLRTSDPATGWSHPAWLVERWRAALGDEDLQKLLAWDNTPPRTFARANTLCMDVAQLRERWRVEEVAHDLRTYDWTGPDVVFPLRSHPPLTDLPSFRQGGFYVQDPSTLLAVHELAPLPGETVLDFCAAPGGKTTYMAQLMGNRGRIVAHDSSPERLKLVAENCARLSATCVQLAATRETAIGAPASYDRILVDAPCSNTGVLRRRVELRWRLTPEEITRLAAEQSAILRQVAPALKPGGILVYSTCSLEAEENHDVIARFVAEETGFELLRELQLHPVTAEVDGAYVAVLRRK
jgi:16S rRNA (cytosine967-C5)-methyltransferase